MQRFYQAVELDTKMARKRESNIDSNSNNRSKSVDRITNTDQFETVKIITAKVYIY